MEELKAQGSQDAVILYLTNETSSLSLNVDLVFCLSEAQNFRVVCGELLLAACKQLFQPSW